MSHKSSRDQRIWKLKGFYFTRWDSNLEHFIRRQTKQLKKATYMDMGKYTGLVNHQRIYLHEIDLHEFIP